MEKLVITIDGPAASGKSTVARLLADRLGASFLDTGAMYRAVTLAAMQAKVDMSNEDELLNVLNETDFDFPIMQGQMSALINGVDVTEDIRSKEVTANARYIASPEKVRERLVQIQRKIATGEEKIVTEGRDQGTIAFADADIKFYLTADINERARRRQVEQKDSGSIDEIKKTIEERDSSDCSRDIGPLKPADDAIIVDTTKLSISEVVEKLFGYVREKCS